MRRLLLPVLLLALLAVPAVAQANYEAVLQDCANPAHNEQLTKTYTIKEYQQALANMPGDQKEYTGCYDVIQQAMRDVASGGSGTGSSVGIGGGGTGGSSTGGGGGTGGAAATGAGDPLATATPQDQAAAAQAQAAGATPIQVGAAVITPGDPGTAASSIGDLPTPLLILIGVALVAALAGLALLVKNLVLGRTST